jgi:5-methylcytosine-specific restriction endonuclease McrA
MPDVKLTIEHIMPQSRGGPTSWENCVAACEDCNTRKADMTPNEAGMKLRTKPQKPTWTPRLRLPHGKVIRESWKPFLEKEAVA